METKVIVTDDLTNMSRRALDKIVKNENLGISEEEAMNLTPDEYRDKIRERRLALGITQKSNLIDLPPAPPKNEVKREPLVIKALPFHQLGRDCFAAVVTYRDLHRLAVNPKAQRQVTKARVPEIRAYVAANDGYFAGGTLNIAGGVEYVESEQALFVSPDADVFILDGQHRWVGITAFLEANDDVERLDDGFAATVYTNLSEGEQQQAFHDVNAYQKKPNRPLTLSFNNRDTLHRFVAELIEKSPVFAGNVNTLKAKVGAKDRETFTFSIIYDAVNAMFDDLSDETYDQRMADALSFWSKVGEAMKSDWSEKGFATTKNAMVAIARLYGFNVNFEHLALIDWSENGEVFAAAKEAGGSNAAIKAISDVLAKKVVEDEEA